MIVKYLIIFILILLIYKAFSKFELFNIKKLPKPILKCGSPSIEGTQLNEENLQEVISQMQISDNLSDTDYLVNFYEIYDQNRLYISDQINQNRNLVTVDPESPDCIGICINQHTFTPKNSDKLLNFSEDLLGEVKGANYQREIMNTGCGSCINNFYSGLKLMKDNINDCN